MALRLSEVAKARRKLAIEHKNLKETQPKPKPAQNSPRGPVFVSSRTVSAA